MSEPKENLAKRHVMVILCDQLRPDFLPMYGCDALKTPNFDRLAARGVVFDRALTPSPVCGPARASLMTGRYPSDHGVWTNDIPFREGLTYLAERMNGLGYKTAAFGKLHHTPGRDPKGFGRVRHMEENRLGDEDDYLKFLKTRHPEVESVFNQHDHTFAFEEEAYYEHWIASETVTHLEAHAKGEAPLFTWVSFQGPHTPYDPPRNYQGTVDAARLPKPIPRIWDVLPEVAKYRSALLAVPENEAELQAMRTSYAETIVCIDRQLGRILDALEEKSLFDQTTLIFSADHGDLLGDYGLNQKGPFPYSPQLTVPLVISNHPGIAAGTRSDLLVSALDIASTALDIAGGEPLGQSRSLLKQLAQPDYQREVNYCEFCDSVRFVETAQFRLAYYPFTGKRQLFDLNIDPMVHQNLAHDPAYAQIVIEMLQHLLDFGILAKGVRVEAYDFVPSQQAGLRRKDPEFVRDFPVAVPVQTRAGLKRLKDAGLDETYNEFCKTRPILTPHPVYWQDEQLKDDTPSVIPDAQ